MRYLIFILLLTRFISISNAIFINYKGDADVLRSTCFGWASRDVRELLIALPGEDITVELIKGENFVFSSNADSMAKYNGFEWKFSASGITLTAASYKGFADGLYALLQEKLGFKFYHPREMLKPEKIDWPSETSLTGEPVFDKMGFHIHTMHPLELTESFLDENSPNALNNVKEYIDWLARNGQNYFEFNLLESINRDTWIAHAKQITEYSHSRGIYCGVDLSLHMIQQKAFQLYTGMLNKESKIEKNAAWLLAAGFDLWNVELSSTEFSQGDQEEKKKLLEKLGSILRTQGVKLMSRSHVVKADNMVSGKEAASNDQLLAPDHGLMVHTVMFYSLNDSIAPVYENKNLHHMRDLLLQEKEKREVWYYPESAYWITFDNSVPMFLMPYLSARLDDINYCEQEKIIGHLTFSSGWEWGYWLIDWSIARWSWNYTENGKLKEKYPLQYVDDISINQDFKDFVKRSADLQQKYIKDEELIRVLVAQTITDEIPGPFNLELHPRPKYTYKYIRNKATLEELEYVKKNYLEKLTGLIDTSRSIDTYSLQVTNNLTPLEKELYDGIYITNIRAHHRWLTLSYLTSYRKEKVTHSKLHPEDYLDAAKQTRLAALEVVGEREKNYRYPLSLLSGQYESRTAYHHGYLFTVHNLHFWEREELQAKKNKYKFWYRSIWNIPRIIGLVN